nr:hypothetical protein [Streptomyces sp. CJ_13]
MRVHTRHCWDTRSRCTPAGADQIRPLLAQGIPARCAAGTRSDPHQRRPPRGPCRRRGSESQPADRRSRRSGAPGSAHAPYPQRATGPGTRHPGAALRGP